MSKKKQIEGCRRIEGSIILVDLSGFTQLLYHASNDERLMNFVLHAMKRLFDDAMKAADASDDVRIINNTGDGFIALATGTKPSRAAVDFAHRVQDHFKTYVSSIIGSMPFRQRTELRIALHHGHVHEIDIERHGEPPYQVYVSDDINLLARVVNSQVARRQGLAITRSFLRRLMQSKGELPLPAEVILDRNRYPEQIEVYGLPEQVSNTKAR